MNNKKMIVSSLLMIKVSRFDALAKREVVKYTVNIRCCLVVGIQVKALASALIELFEIVFVPATSSVHKLLAGVRASIEVVFGEGAFAITRISRHLTFGYFWLRKCLELYRMQCSKRNLFTYDLFCRVTCPSNPWCIPESFQSCSRWRWWCW